VSRTGAETRDHILATTERMLDHGDFASISLLEICTAADVSSSSLYHFFRTKEDLCAALHERLLERSVARLSGFTDALRELSDPLDDRIRFAITAASFHLIDHRGYLTSMANLERSRADLRRQRAQFHRGMVAAITEALVAPSPDVSPDVPVRLELAMRVVASTLIGAFTDGGLVYADDLPPKDLAAELTTMVSAYVREGGPIGAGGRDGGTAA